MFRTKITAYNNTWAIGGVPSPLDRFVVAKPGEKVRLIHMGDIPADPSVRLAVMRRQLLVQTMPGCPAALAIGQLAGKLQESLIAKPK